MCSSDLQYEKTVMGCELVAKKVPVTVTRCVPKMVTYQVPVQVYNPCSPCGEAVDCGPDACDAAGYN